jgi:imidazolonepropionase-like amidohydrolase
MIDSWPKLKHPSEAEAFVQEQITKSGASYIKLFHELGDTINMSLPRPPLDIQRAVVKAAHAHGLIAVGHAFSCKGAIDLLTCGVDGLTHIFLDKPTSRDYITLSQQNKAYCNPTLSTCGSQTQEGHEMQTRFTADPLAQKMLFDTQPRQPLAMGAANASIEHAYESVRALYEAKVPIIIGSDSSGQLKGTAYGLGVHMEIYLLTHKIKMSAVDVLKGATSLTADRFGFHDRGRIGVGKKADLVLLEGDVREILADEESLCLPVRGVWRDGIVASVWGDVGLV